MIFNLFLLQLLILMVILEIYNLTYDDNGKIENSCKIDGYNHIDGVDNINDNKDYGKNENNIYNLYIPLYAMDRMRDYNGIFLLIQGGVWIMGNKKSMDTFCKLVSTQGYNIIFLILLTIFKEYYIIL